MTWLIKAITRRNGNKNSVQSSVIDKKKLIRADVVSLVTGDHFFQVFGSIVTRKLRYSPDEFQDVEKYNREIQSIGIWIEKKR